MTLKLEKKVSVISASSQVTQFYIEAKFRKYQKSSKFSHLKIQFPHIFLITLTTIMLSNYWLAPVIAGTGEDLTKFVSASDETKRAPSGFESTLEFERQTMGSETSTNAQRLVSSGAGPATRGEASTMDTLKYSPIEVGERGFDEFLEGLPVISVGEKHLANIECDLRENKQGDLLKLVWVKLTRFNGSNDVKLISLNQKIITPDRKFKVRKQSALKWLLIIESVSIDDNEAYFLCQTNSAPAGQVLAGNGSGRPTDNGTSFGGAGYVGGAKLNVLVPPKFVLNETSASSIQVDEFDSLNLKCKVVSQPQAQLTWKREDRKEFDLSTIEQRFKHEFNRSKSGGQILSSTDSSELQFHSISRNQAGPHLCIASNGVSPGISQRINIEVINCRPSVESKQTEACQQKPVIAPERDSPPTSTAQPARVRNWKTTSARGNQSKQQRQQSKNHQLAMASTIDGRRRNQSTQLNLNANSDANEDNSNNNQTGHSAANSVNSSSSLTRMIQEVHLLICMAFIYHIAVLVNLASKHH